MSEWLEGRTLEQMTDWWRDRAEYYGKQGKETERRLNLSLRGKAFASINISSFPAMNIEFDYPRPESYPFNITWRSQCWADRCTTGLEFVGSKLDPEKVRKTFEKLTLLGDLYNRCMIESQHRHHMRKAIFDPLGGERSWHNHIVCHHTVEEAPELASQVFDFLEREE